MFYQLFQVADTTNLGVITGEVAVPFFEKTKLPPESLGLVCFSTYTPLCLALLHSVFGFLCCFTYQIVANAGVVYGVDMADCG